MLQTVWNFENWNLDIVSNFDIRISNLQKFVSKRIQRVNQLIKEELSQIILKEIEFPQNVLVTITRVETSANLTESKVWVSVMFTPHQNFGGEAEEKSKRVLEILNKNIYFLQQKLNQRLKMRPIPRIKFLEERKTIQAAQIEEILERLKKEPHK